MDKSILKIGNFTCTVSELEMLGIRDPARDEELKTLTNKILKLVQNTPYSAQCPCKIISCEDPFLDTDFAIPVTKNDTPASIAEAVIKNLERRY